MANSHTILDNDSFLYAHNNKLYHFIYMKKSPIYECAIFDSDGDEHFGQLNDDGIRELIDVCDMKNLMENNYEVLKSHFPSLTRSDYEDKLSFTKLQFA